MGYNSRIFAMTVALLALAGPAWSAPASTGDLWDVSQGTVVTANSAVLNYGDAFFVSDPRNMLGFFQSGTVEPPNTLFSDDNGSGFKNFIEWQTSSAITLRSFNLLASHDGPGGTRAGRGMDSFTLFAFDGATFVQIFSSDFTGSPQYDPSGLISPCLCELELERNVVPVTSDRFRAEFVQTGAGTRIKELDGYDTFFTSQPVPEIGEPTTMALLGLGLAGLGVMRRRRAA